MPEIIECVINISEGRDVEKIRRISSGIESIDDAWLLGTHSDGEHNRSVLTLAGTPRAMEEAARAVFESALEKIDLREHQGLHPRVGAVDVVPFVPIRGPMERCVDLAREFGKWAAEKVSIPVFLYEKAAILTDRKNLAQIRKGGLEGLSQRMRQDPDWKPDYGPLELHPTGGAVVVGARDFLLAFNVLLDSRDLELARRIAREIRESGGGLPHVRALGLFLESREVVQISMNLTDFRQTSLYVVFEEISLKTEEMGVSVLESEVVGFLPREALSGGNVELLRIRSFGPGLVLEDRIEALTGWEL